MRYLDQCERSLPDRFPEEVCDAILRDNVMHVRPRDPHAIPGLQQWFDSGGTIISSGTNADDGLATGGARRTTDETRLRGHSAVELAFELVDADLARQIDRKGLCDRNHARLAGHLLGMAHLIDGKEMEPRIIVDKVVEPARSQAVAGDDPIAITRFAAASHYAGLDQIHEPVGDDVAMDAEVAPIPEMTQRLIWDPAQADLQGRAVLDDRGDIACHTLCDVADLRMEVLSDRRINFYYRIKSVEMTRALAVGARHRWIDLRDNRARNAQDCGREIHGHPEADEAPRIRRGNLKQSHIDRQPSAGQQSRYFFQRDRHIVQLS